MAEGAKNSDLHSSSSETPAPGILSSCVDKTLIGSYLELVKSANVNTLREISRLNSNLINDMLFPVAPTVPKTDDQFNALFTYIPSILNGGQSLDVSTHLKDGSGHDELNFRLELQNELDSLHLGRMVNSEETGRTKVSTKWLVNTPNSHPDLKSALDINDYPYICKLRDAINAHEDCTGDMNGCIVNCYGENSYRIRPHSDDEPYVNQQSSISTFSMGASRQFGIFSKSHGNPELLKTYQLNHGSVMIMQPGSQASTKHKVLPLSHSEGAVDPEKCGLGTRYSFSFRSIIPPISKSDEVKAERINTTLIFGSSISKRLSADKLTGRSKNKLVVNLSVSGSKIKHMTEHMDNFISQNHEYFKSPEAVPIDKMNITNVIFCIGTNDILNADTTDAIGRLYTPLEKLLRKAQVLFQCDVHLQSVIPIPTNSHRDSVRLAEKVRRFNRAAVDVCKATRCKYLDVFDDFLECDSFYKFYCTKRFNQNSIDIHPNRVGCSILARAYIPICRGYFNPITQPYYRYNRR